MNIEMQKLTPALAQEYADFFDKTPHNHSGKGVKCYCVTFCKDSVYQGGGSHWYDTPDERKLHGIKRVENGEIQGYLAYYDDDVIGWCNANTKSDCQEVMNFMHSVNKVPLDECKDGEKIKFIFCFVVSPNMQRMGVATKLLDYICQDAALEGFDFIEAQASKDFADDGFRGILSMYEKCGFYVHAERDDKIVVRKALKSIAG